METDTKVPASAGGCSLDSLVGLAEKRVETHRNVKLARQTLREAVTALELAMARMAEADMLYQQSSQSNDPSSLTASRKAADEWKGAQCAAAGSESPRGFITAPTMEQLRPTPAEREHLRGLLEWQKASAKSAMIFGPSWHCPKCHAMNNPNNPCCHQCGSTPNDQALR